MTNIYDTFDYSIDMVRMSAEVKTKHLKEVMDEFMNSFKTNTLVDYREYKQINGYRHNWIIKGLIEEDKEMKRVYFDESGEIHLDKQEQYSFWLGACHNAKKEDINFKEVVIEYNPNKCKNSILLKYFLKEFFINNKTTVVKKIDFAIDIYQNIKNIFLIRDNRSSYRLIDNGGDDITHYMRKRGSHGGFKLYNKSREQKLDINKTRYEITLHVNLLLSNMDFYEPDYGVFPNIRLFTADKQLELNVNGMSDKVTSTDKILADACIDVPGRLKELPYRKAKKIEAIINNLYHLLEFTDCPHIKSTINKYFNNLLNI